MTRIILTEEIKLPSPLAEAFLTNRPELLKTIGKKPNFTPEQQAAWVDAFRVFMATMYRQQEEVDQLLQALRLTRTKNRELKTHMSDMVKRVTEVIGLPEKLLRKFDEEGEEDDGKDVRKAVDSVPHLEG